ncbi:MAG: PQQ-dependent sugar dehydrogenase [Synechococcales bacterium]|nr:PQQ-dependent sugar dehydrogenase [Synechococcales bacterium]
MNPSRISFIPRWRALQLGILSSSIAIAACSFTSSPPIPSGAAQPADSTPATRPVSKSQALQKVTLLEGLERPWSMAWLPDGAILITEKAGRLRIVRNGKLDPTPIAGVPAVMNAGQGGLLDMTVHPGFAQNRWIYLSHAQGTPDANWTRVIRAKFDGQALKDIQVIVEVTQPKSTGQHFGSRFLWLPDTTLLVAIGDGGNPPVQLAGDLIRKQAQNLSSRLGKIIRVNADGSIPNNNPFIGKMNADTIIWSYGHRNIQGLAFDPIARRIWATEHGARGGDELNLVEAGKNYGWPLVTHSQEYFGGEISPNRSRPGMVNPKQVWTPAIAPSGLAFYTGDRFPHWQGDLFAGGLVSQDVRRLDLDRSGNVQGQEAIAIGQRVRDVRQGPDGYIYILTDDQNGRLIRLEANNR